VTHHDRIRATGEEWLAGHQSFASLILWKLEHPRRISEGGFIDKFEELAEEDEPFFSPIRSIDPD